MVTHAELNQRLHAAIGVFVSEFAALESIQLMHVLTVLSLDQTLALGLGGLMELHNKIELIKHMARERDVRGGLLSDLTKALNKAKSIGEKRNVIVHNAASLFMMPADAGFSSDPVLGVNIPPSKRKLKVGASLRERARAMVMELSEIDGYTRELVELNKALQKLIAPLHAHMGRS
jgi:hypothetical protein